MSEDNQQDHRPPVCNYEGSNYQADFWDRGGRAYEDGAEAVALKRLLPASGRRMLEVGAGAGRNTPRYKNFDSVVLMDYSITQLQQAQQRLEQPGRYLYVAADVYRLPFRQGVFDAATMIRVLHHMASPQQALQQVRDTLVPGAVFILEFANKRNLKALMRYWLKQQEWDPNTEEPVEYIPLNFDYHPNAVRRWLKVSGFEIQRQLTVSHFRINLIKRVFPTGLLVWLDSLAQLTGGWWQLSPSVFVRNQAVGDTPNNLDATNIFSCPECRQPLPEPDSVGFNCTCGLRWIIQEGIYNFKKPVSNSTRPSVPE